VQSRLGVEAKDVAALSRTRTVGEVISAMANEMGGAAPAPARQAPGVPASTGAASAKATQVVMEVLASKTGYDVDMIEDDMELETELGIDSIKRVEILSEVQSRLKVEAKDVAALSRTRTVGEVIEAMQNEMKNNSGTPLSNKGASVHSSATTSAATPSGPTACDIANRCGLTLSFAGLKQISTPEILETEAPADRPVVIVDSGFDANATNMLRDKIGRSRAVVLHFGDRTLGGARTIRLADNSEASLTAALEQVERQFGVIGGFVFQSGAHTDGDSVSKAREGLAGWCLMAAKHVKESLHRPIVDGRCFFMCVTRMDGRLGLAGTKDIRHPQVGDDVLKVSECGRVFGLVKTLGLEWPSVFVRAVDVHADADGMTCATHVHDEMLCADSTLREVGYDLSGQRFTTEGCALRDDPAETNARLPQYAPSDVFLVAGGGRGITPHCMAALARRVGGGTFFLLGRSKVSSEPAWARGLDGAALKKAATNELKRAYAANGKAKEFKPTPRRHKALLKSVEGSRAVNESIAKINASGGTAHYLACDVTDAASVRAAVREVESTHGLTVTGLVQASGVLRDKLVHNKTLADFKLVYGTKVTGLRNMLDSVRDQSQLRQIVVFSSLAGFHGNVGQSDYAMANEVLNKAAHSLAARLPSCRVRALDFGPWDGGMVTPQLKAMFKSQGVEIIPYDEGSEIVAAMLCDMTSVQGLVGNWGLPPVRPKRKRHTLTKALRPSLNGFLDSHQIQQKRVVPLAVAACSMAESARGLYQGYRVQSIDDVKVFAGVKLDAHADTTTVISLEEDEKTSTDALVRVKCTLSTLNPKSGRALPAYKCSVLLTSARADERDGNSTSIARRPNLQDERTQWATARSMYDGTTLFHGRHFQMLEKVLNVSSAGITIQCKKDPQPELLGQYSGSNTAGLLDSVTLDGVMQAFLVWARDQRGCAALPTSASSVEFLRKVPDGAEYFISLDADASLSTASDSVWKAGYTVHDARGTTFARGRAAVTLNESLKF
jgi:acyl carrier protein